MNEPLKGKLMWLVPKKSGFMVKDVKSAVEWLRGEIYKEYRDKSLPIPFHDIEKKIDEAFPDLCPSGDLIADKQNPQDKCNHVFNDIDVCERCHKHIDDVAD